MAALFKRNDAIETNGPPVTGLPADIGITDDGSSVFFAVAAIMGAATLAFVAMSLTKPRAHRLFHYITASITLVAFIAYFCMGAHLGWTPINVEFQRDDPEVSGSTREIYYVRYVDWAITTPLLLLDLCLTAGLPWPTILFVIFLNESMIVTGLIGALVASVYKWAFFTFGCVALIYIVWVLAFEARLHARHLGADVSKVFFQCGSLTAFIWLLYPIAWGLSEGGNVIAPDSEAAFYSVLDVLAKPVFGFLLLWGHRNIDPARLGLRIRDYEEDPAIIGGTTGDKAAGTV